MTLFVIKPEANLHSDLEVLDGSVLDMSANLRNLEPVNPPQSGCRPRNCVANCLSVPSVDVPTISGSSQSRV